MASCLHLGKVPCRVWLRLSPGVRSRAVGGLIPRAMTSFAFFRPWMNHQKSWCVGSLAERSLLFTVGCGPHLFEQRHVFQPGSWSEPVKSTRLRGIMSLVTLPFLSGYRRRSLNRLGS